MVAGCRFESGGRGPGGDVAATEWDLPPESGSGLVRAFKGACGRICAVMVQGLEGSLCVEGESLPRDAEMENALGA